ncbi:MAG: enoyl-CoA hydratase/isomerase family protein [Candidatus Sericytochromatia bacterium]
MHTLQRTLEDGIQTVTLDRGKANAINHAMLRELRQTVAETNANPEIRGSLLTGKAPFFSAGLDVIELYDYDATTMKSFWQDLSGLLADLAGSPKPWVAAITGHSPAGGCVLALCCDQRVMAEGNYRIGLNEVPVGIAVPQPIYHLYASVLGARLAYQMLMEGRLVLPETAREIGLVDAVAPMEEVLTEARKRLHTYLALDDTTWQQTKRLLRAPLVEQLSPDFDSAFGTTLEHWWSEASRKQVGAMIDKLKAGKK